MEGGRKVSASPRGPWSGVSRRKVLANKRPRTDGFVNSVKKLQRREISSKRDRSFSMTNAQERFRNMRLTIASSHHLGRASGRQLCLIKGQGEGVMVLSRYIQRGKPDAGFPLFVSEYLKYPGFVEFDDVNGKVLTYSAQDSIYKVFDLKNYTLLYSISDKHVQEIKISPGIMLLIFNRAQSHVPLKILSIEDGTVLKDFNHLLHRNKKVDFIEQFNEKLLVKQENENLQILDVRNAEHKEVSRTEFMTPSAFIFLYENQLFLTFRNRTVAVWNFRGELVTSFEDHLLWHPDCNTNNIYITSDQDLIISYCKADSDDQWMEGNAGSINISNILTGKCLAKINSSNCNIEVDGGYRSDSTSRNQHCSYLMRNRVAEALEDITALFYDEERNEIYTGNRHGLVHVWSS
ncbi:hypothetical protein RHMOL_Rhmol05G0324600 [Rhododendron molle]|uniref:Uncharacterized protein n=1 Tax=Rhododendron molle TaxID=49168 RepID=A0ACC0NVH7_RHOML|nr:hypothetical protein RHMOL_Rhmol05G0324600 [Rhododendron molle]